MTLRHPVASWLLRISAVSHHEMHDLVSTKKKKGDLVSTTRRFATPRTRKSGSRTAFTSSSSPIFACLYSRVMSHSYVWHDSFICVTWLIHMTHSAPCHSHDSFICATWLIHMTHSAPCHSYNLFICVTWLITMCDMTHPYVWHDSFICVRHDSFICATWLIHMCDMTHSYVWRDSFTCATWHIHMCDMTHS